MAYTFKNLKDEVRATIFPSGEPENLIASHDKFFVESLYDLQQWILCLRFSNVNVLPHCATYFNCGMTVLPAPRGIISRIYVIDRIDPETGLESADGEDEWCQKVDLERVDYCHIQSYVNLCQRCSGTTNASVIDAIMGAFFGIFRNKRSFKKPTDEGLESLPSLPQGFHYPQSSTDATGRSPYGVFAIHHGRIYIAPWIQSTETVVVEWVGIKRQWGDDDLVDDDPKFKQAVRLHVGMQHERDYNRDMNAYAVLKTEFQQVLAELMHECREETRVRNCGEAGQNGSEARGLGATDLATAAFYNDRQQYTAKCPMGQDGDDVTVVVEAGSVGSALSVADANARAMQQAADDANARIVCEDEETIYRSVAQTYTANCAGAYGDPGSAYYRPAAVGNPVTVTVPVGAYTSTVSQAAADAAALAAAVAEANNGLSCTFYNAEQTYTASCPSGTVGSDVERTVAASTHSSTVSQADANTLALADAQNQAVAALSCGSGTFIIGNTPQSGFAQVSCPNGGFSIGTAVVPASRITAVATAATQATIQAQLNQAARDQANAEAQVKAYAACPPLH